jgi:hypothetical protein
LKGKAPEETPGLFVFDLRSHGDFGLVENRHLRRERNYRIAAKFYSSDV